LTGVVLATGCDGLRRLADVWAHYGPGDVYVLDVPRRRDPPALVYFQTELRALAGWLAQLSGRALDEKALRSAIDRHNETRHLLARLDERRQAGWPIPATEILALVDRWGEEEPATLNRRLAGLLAEPSPNTLPATGVPIVLSGNILAPADRFVLGLVEAAGARIASDDLCSGMRAVLGEVAVGPDPYVALAQRYLERTPCPRCDDPADRFAQIAQLCQSTGARGVIYASQKFCDGSLYDFGPLREHLEAAGVHVLLLELDATAVMPGQARTRIEAFLETL